MVELAPEYAVHGMEGSSSEEEEEEEEGGEEEGSSGSSSGEEEPEGRAEAAGPGSGSSHRRRHSDGHACGGGCGHHHHHQQGHQAQDPRSHEEGGGGEAGASRHPPADHHPGNEHEEAAGAASTARAAGPIMAGGGSGGGGGGRPPSIYGISESNGLHLRLEIGILDKGDCLEIVAASAVPEGALRCAGPCQAALRHGAGAGWAQRMRCCCGPSLRLPAWYLHALGEWCTNIPTPCAPPPLPPPQAARSTTPKAELFSPLPPAPAPPPPPPPPVPPGCEVHNTYGEHGNAELVAKYGFALRQNPFTAVALDKGKVRRSPSASPAL